MLFKKRSSEKAMRSVASALGHPLRWKILDLLCASDKSLCFAEICVSTLKKAPEVSYHIRILEKAKLVINERKLDTTTGKARTSFYRIPHAKKKLIKNLIQLISELLE
jgi:DNA-binding transcriptional ArsR family regulator